MFLRQKFGYNLKIWIPLVLKRFGSVTGPPQGSEHPIYDPWYTNSPRGSQPRTKTGGRTTISMIPGKGSGPEMLEAVMEVLECGGAPIACEWIQHDDRETLLEYTKLSIIRNGIAIKGEIENNIEWTRTFDGEKTINFRLRDELDLFVNVVECVSLHPLKNHMKIHEEINTIIMRSNTEGEFSLIEHQPHPSVVEHVRVITTFNTKRVAHHAFKYAKAHDRKKVSIIHNRLALPMSEGLYVDTFFNVASDYKPIKAEALELNTAVKRILRNPMALDVVITNGVYGSMLIGMINGMIGSKSLIMAVDQNDRYSVFEPAGKSKGMDTEEGRNCGNPTAYLLCAAAALDAAGIENHGDNIRKAINAVFESGLRTRDLGGTSTTKEFVKAMVQNLKKSAPNIMCHLDDPPPLPDKKKKKFNKMKWWPDKKEK